jgi:hypothetical protein
MSHALPDRRRQHGAREQGQIERNDGFVQRGGRRFLSSGTGNGQVSRGRRTG